MSIKTTSLGPRSENKTILWIKIMEYRYIIYSYYLIIIFPGFVLRIKFPRIWVEEDDATKFCPGEVFKAIADNDVKYLKYLISEGYPINFRDVHMMTPLHRACSRYNL